MPRNPAGDFAGQEVDCQIGKGAKRDAQFSGAFGKTIYHIDSVIREENRIVDNGLKVICVNTKNDDSTEIAALMKCFLQSEVNDVRFPQISQRVHYLKHSQGGRHSMCKIMEDFAKEYAKEYAKETAKETAERMIKKGKFSLEDIADCVPDLTLDEIKEIEAKIMNPA